MSEKNYVVCNNIKLGKKKVPLEEGCRGCYFNDPNAPICQAPTTFTIECFPPDKDDKCIIYVKESSEVTTLENDKKENN